MDDSINEQFIQPEAKRPSYESGTYNGPGTGSSSSRRPNSVNLSDRSIASKEKSDARKSGAGQRHSIGGNHYRNSNNNNVNHAMNQYGEVRVTNVVNNITLNVSGLVGKDGSIPKEGLTVQVERGVDAIPKSKIDLCKKSPGGRMNKSGESQMKNKNHNGLKSPDGSSLNSSFANNSISLTWHMFTSTAFFDPA